MKIEKLSDLFGQYEIYLKCQCGHTRRCSPKTFANLAGWDALLQDVIKRLRCSKCNARHCSARTIEADKPKWIADRLDSKPRDS